MPDAPPILLAAGFAFAWVGHAAILTAVLNDLYGRPIPKLVLKPWRYGTGAAIAGFPLLLLAGGPVVLGYLGVCLVWGLVVLPAITAARLLRPTPPAVVSEKTEARDFGAELGPAAVGDGIMRWAARLPLNGIYRVEFTDLTLSVPGLPPEWDGLTVLHLTDLHFHGTPSRAWFDRVFDEIAARWPTPDVVVLAGDFLDRDSHLAWVAPLLGRLTWNACGLAVLGNHDVHCRPDDLRRELAGLGYEVLGNGWKPVTVRGVEAVAVGHEGPWIGPPPDLSAAPAGPFRLCVSHTPDNFYWGQRNRVGLMLCGHVHGGQIRVPAVGSIFVPSVYGRRFDMGVFEGGGTVMAVGRGLSGKEPLRWRCPPQVLRLTLTPRRPVG